MGLIAAKCSQCGASIELDGKGNGRCPNCGTRYIKEDVVINKVTNNIFNERAGNITDKQAVLEKMLIEYYKGGFNDYDNMKEYSFRVLEGDKNNALANFVAFNNINDEESILKLLRAGVI